MSKFKSNLCKFIFELFDSTDYFVSQRLIFLTLEQLGNCVPCTPVQKNPNRPPSISQYTSPGLQVWRRGSFCEWAVFFLRQPHFFRSQIRKPFSCLELAFSIRWQSNLCGGAGKYAGAIVQICVRSRVGSRYASVGLCLGECIGAI